MTIKGPVADEITEDDLIRPCGCAYGDPHVGDCQGYREPTKDDYLEMYERNPDVFEDEWY